MTNTQEISARIASAIERDLRGRSGMDWDLDGATENEIRSTWQNIVKTGLDSQTRYFLDHDNDGNWFLVPVNCCNEWSTWVNRTDFRLHPRPERAMELQTTHYLVTFTDPIEGVPL